MRRLLWIVAWMAVALWSLFAWGAYGLLDFFSGVAARNADVVTGHPESVEWLSWALTTLRGLGLGAIVFVWAVVSLLILAVPAVLGLFFGSARQDQRAQEWRGPVTGPGTSGPFPPSTGPYPPRRIEKR
jgi:ABC-type Na+ efflux pump permease subunit